MVSMEAMKRERIIRDITDNVFVEAGAGAGKTSLIIQRVVNQLRQGMKPEHIVIITFTNAAAGELYGRMAKVLSEEVKKDTVSEKEKEILQSALEHMDRMTISTIHSFCFKLLKERCFEAAIPMDAELLEPGKEKEYKIKFLKQWLKECTKEEIRELKQASLLYAENVYFREWLEETFVKICDKPEDVAVICPDETRRFQMLQELQEADRLLEQQTQKTEEVKEQKRLEQEQECIRLEEEIENEVERLAEELTKVVNRLAGTSYQTPEELAAAGKLYKKYVPVLEKTARNKASDLMKKIYEKQEAVYQKKSGTKPEIVSQINEAYLELLNHTPLWEQKKQLEELNGSQELPEERELKEQKEQRKEKAGQYFYYVLLYYAKKAVTAYKESQTGRWITNNELLERTRNLVCASVAARAYFAEKYRCIYIDEFQDTDHIQAELLWQLCCEENGQLRPGSLFVVGDPKQAIYRFRGGEPAVYYEIKERMKQQKAGTRLYTLHDNYRSSWQMIDWINKNFSNASMGNLIEYNEMNCRKPKEETATGVLQGVYTLDSQISGIPVRKKAEMEAKRLSETILRFTEGTCQIYEGEGETRKLRKVEYRDFLILCWKMKDMKVYAQEFQKSGIPVEFSGNMGLKKSRLLHNFCRIYQYLASYSDKKAREGIYPVLERAGTAVLSEPKAKERLELLIERTKGLDAYALAQYLVSHPEYVMPWEQELSKENLYTAQIRLRQMVENVCQEKRGTAQELAAKFIEYRDKVLERELPLKENQNAVRFMNIHKAKGLEGSIVILTNRTGYGEKRPLPDLTKHLGAGECYAYYGTVQRKNKNFGWKETLHGYGEYPDALEMAWKEEYEEDVRLEYVAATRAKEALIVMSSYSSPAPFESYESSIFQDVDLFFQQAAVPVVSMSRTLQCSDYVPQQYNSLAKLKEICYTTLSPSQLEHYAQKKEEEDGTETDKEQRPKGKVFGTVMHRSFELLVTSCWEILPALSEEEMKKRICFSVCQAMMEQEEELRWEGKRLYNSSEDSRQEYLEIVKEYLEKALYRFAMEGALKEILKDAKEVYTELPFSYYVYPESKEQQMMSALKPYLEAAKHETAFAMDQPVWINGTADLVVQRNDGTILIVDYKSDSKKNCSEKEFEELLQQRYAGQLLVYRYSMSRLFKVAPETIEVRLQHLY